MAYWSRARRATSLQKTKDGRKSKSWTYWEKKALCAALKKYGFDDTKLLASEVKTKNQDEVEHFINTWTRRTAERHPNALNMSKLFCPVFNSSLYAAESFPAIAQWKKVVFSIVQKKLRREDYSYLLSELYKKFAEEEPECNDPNMPNFKNVYEFLSDVLNDTIPGYPSPVDSCIILKLMEDIIKFVDKFDIKEELTFAKEFLGPIKFIPIFKEDVELGLSKFMTESYEPGSAALPLLVVESDEAEEYEESSQPQGNWFQEPCEVIPKEEASCSQMDECGSAALPLLIERGDEAEENSQPQENGCQKRHEASLMGEASCSQINGDASASSFYGNIDCKPEILDDLAMNSDLEMLSLPLSIFEYISQHLKVKQNLNPLMTPVYLLQKEQALIKEFVSSSHTRDV